MASKKKFSLSSFRDIQLQTWLSKILFLLFLFFLVKRLGLHGVQNICSRKKESNQKDFLHACKGINIVVADTFGLIW